MTLQLLHGDCLELMKDLPDKSIDLFVCDLPYGCLTNKPKADGSEGKIKGGLRARYINGEDTGTVLNLKTVDVCAWDIPIDLTQFWVQVKRLCKNDHTPVLMFCNAKFGYELIKSNESWFRYDLVWSKTNGVGFLSANKQPLRSHELIYVFSKKGANYTRIDGTPNLQTTEAGRRCVKSVIEMSNKKGKGKHPTQKPENLYEWLITRYSKEGDTILDPTAGSFASCFTAQRLGRNAIGMEKDEGFFNKAKNLTEK